MGHPLNFIPALCLTALLAVSGCSTDSAKRIAYDSLQNYSQLRCQKMPSADCPKGETYEEYQKHLEPPNAPRH